MIETMWSVALGSSSTLHCKVNARRPRTAPGVSGVGRRGSISSLWRSSRCALWRASTVCVAQRQRKRGRCEGAARSIRGSQRLAYNPLLRSRYHIVGSAEPAAAVRRSASPTLEGRFAPCSNCSRTSDSPRVSCGRTLATRSLPCLRWRSGSARTRRSSASSTGSCCDLYRTPSRIVSSASGS